MTELKGLAASMGLYDDKKPCKRAVILGKAIKALEQQKTGQWEDISNGIEYDWGTCNKCKARIPMTYKYYEFCPHCGAKMTESEDKE